MTCSHNMVIGYSNQNFKSFTRTGEFDGWTKREIAFHYCAKCGVTAQSVLEEEVEPLKGATIFKINENLAARVRELEEALTEIISWAKSSNNMRTVAYKELGRTE